MRSNRYTQPISVPSRSLQDTYIFARKILVSNRSISSTARASRTPASTTESGSFWMKSNPPAVQNEPNLFAPKITHTVYTYKNDHTQSKKTSSERVQTRFDLKIDEFEGAFAFETIKDLSLTFVYLDVTVCDSSFCSLYYGCISIGVKYGSCVRC